MTIKRHQRKHQQNPLHDSSATPVRLALGRLRRHAGVRLGGALLGLMGVLALLAPCLYTIDPQALDPTLVGLPMGSYATFTDLAGTVTPRWFAFGTDNLGRDVYSRVIYGTRVSLAIGASVALVSVVSGGVIGLVAGYVRVLDGVFMRVMDGLMAVPAILLAVALVATWGVSITTLVIAIALPDLPRVARVVRAAVLSVKTLAFVEAAQMMGTSGALILWRHIFPATFAPLAVQGTFIFGAAILVEAVLSFLGVGFASDVPTWGNVMASGRANFNVAPHLVLIPGVFLAITIMAINLLGDGLRDVLDPTYAPTSARSPDEQP